MDIKVKKIHPEAKTPNFAHSGDAGMDLFSVEDCIIRPSESYKVKTGISVELPPGYASLIWDKSGVAANHRIKTLGGVIDCGYRGEYMVGLINLGNEDYIIRKGDKVAQLLIQKTECPHIVETSDLSETKRGEGGFGSTGIRSEIIEDRAANIQPENKGLFIAFEGLDGSGSSTQVRLLAKNLNEAGQKTHTTKEPTNNVIGGLIRGVLTREWKIPADGLQLMYSADRAHHLSSEIIPTLNLGNVVITDRYLFSSLAFGSIDLPVEWLEKINERFVLPDITFFIKVSPKECIRRIQSSRNGFELFEEEKKLEKTMETYELLAKDEKNNIIVIDGEKEIPEIEKEIFEIVGERLGIIQKIESRPALEEALSEEARW